MSALICEKCNKEIKPGTQVDYVTPESDDEQRIFTEEDILIFHKKCPEHTFVIDGLYRRPEVIDADSEEEARALYHKLHPGWEGTILRLTKIEPET